MEIVLVLFIFILGISWGSFLNVWIYRIPLGESIAKGRSSCMSCGNTLRSFELIPVFSFLIQKGKCRNCKTKLSWQYPLVELVTGLLFLLTYYIVGLNLILWVVSIFIITVNLVMAKIDWDTTFIPNIISYPSVVLALVYGFFATRIDNYKVPLTSSPTLEAIVPTPTVIDSLIGGAVFFGLLFLIFIISNGGMGLGDAIWSLFMGLMLGWKYAFIALFIGTALTSIFSIVVLLLFNKKIRSLSSVNVTRKDQNEVGEKFLGMSIVNGKPAVVMGPFLAIGMVFAWFYGVPIMEWYLTR